MTAVGLGPAVVVGHSMGSTHALRFAIDHPERVLGLVPVAAFATYRGSRTLARPVPPAFLDTVVQESMKVPARVWRAAFEGFLEDDFTGELGRIRAPTLVVWGDRDTFCSRRDQDTLLAAIAGSRLVIYEGAGHALHWEEPARFAADLTAFAGTLARLT